LYFLAFQFPQRGVLKTRETNLPGRRGSNKPLLIRPRKDSKRRQKKGLRTARGGHDGKEKGEDHA